MSIEAPPGSAPAATIGKYRLIAELGHGGMAEVFLAVVRGPAGFNKLVVVKQIRPQLAEDPEFLGMFLDEARLAARLSHPNVVQTNEVGHELGRYFIAMEYLEGQPLNRVLHRLNKGEGLPLAMHLRVASEVLAGLQHAHELADYDGTPLGVVHRDVTPHNIFITYDGQVKVVDFGIAKAMNSSAETRTGVLKGKVAYMAPEQARGERVDRRADVFSVGVLLWEAAAGKRLWKGVPDITILQRLLSGDIPRPSTVRAVPPRLEAIVMRALANDREHRYPTAADFQNEVEALIDDLGARVTPRDVGRLVLSHFEPDRAKIKALVEEQLRRPEGRLPILDSPTATASAMSLDRVNVSNSDVSGAGVPSVQSSVLPGPSSSYTAASALSSSAIPQAVGPRRGLVAGLALAGGAALAVVFWVMTRSAPSPAAPGTGAAQASAAVAATAAPAPSSTDVDVRIVATPADAKILLDDHPLGANPYRGKLPKGDVTHTVRVQADGYITHTRTISSAKDVDIEMALQKDDREQPEKAEKSGSGRGHGPAGQPPPPKDDDMMRPVPKPRRTLDTSNPYNK